MVISIEGGHYVAKEKYGNTICSDSPTACIQEAVNYIFNNLSNVGKILLKRGVYTINKTITFNTPNVVVLEGEGSDTVLNLAYAPAINIASKVVFKRMRIETNINGYGHITVSGGDVLFEDVVFNLPINTYDRGFITSVATTTDATRTEPIIAFRNITIEQLGNTNTGTYALFAYVPTPAGYYGTILAEGVHVKNIAYNTGGIIFKYSSGVGWVENLVVDNIVGTTQAGFYISAGISILRNIVVKNAVNTRYVDIAEVDIVDGFITNAWGRIGPPTGKLGPQQIITNSMFLAGGGIDAGQPSSGETRRLLVENSVFVGGTIYFGGLESVEINNVLFINSTNGIRYVDEVNSGNPVTVQVSNVKCVYTTCMPTYCITMESPYLARLRVVNSGLDVRALCTSSTTYYLVSLSDIPNAEIHVENCFMRGPGPSSQTKVELKTIEIWSRSSPSNSMVRVVNTPIFGYTIPFGRASLSSLSPCGLPMCQHDRIYGYSPVISASNWSVVAYPDSPFVGTLSPTVGTNSTYGSPVTAQRWWAGYFRDLDASISVSNLSTGETVTVKVEVVWESGNTTYITVPFSAAGTYTLTTGDKLKLISRSGDTPVWVNIYAMSNLSSTSATVSVNIILR